MKKIQKYASSLYSGGSDAPDTPMQHYSAPPFVDSGRRKFLSVLEIIFSCFVVLIVAYWQLFSTVFYCCGMKTFPNPTLFWHSSRSAC